MITPPKGFEGMNFKLYILKALNLRTCHFKYGKMVAKLLKTA